jgi:hypothetical protein
MHAFVNLVGVGRGRDVYSLSRLCVLRTPIIPRIGTVYKIMPNTFLFPVTLSE